MSAFEQGGADFQYTGKKPTKAALKAAIKEDPSKVYLNSTSAFGGFSGYASDLPSGVTFNVVGPDPYTDRRWYASVKHNAKGDVIVT
jgi:hypothetical protein